MLSSQDFEGRTAGAVLFLHVTSRVKTDPHQERQKNQQRAVLGRTPRAEWWASPRQRRRSRKLESRRGGEVAAAPLAAPEADDALLLLLLVVALPP